MIILIGYSVPGFVLAILIIVLLGPGDGAIAHMIPIAGLTSAGTPGYESWTFWEKLTDYLHHLAAPLFCFILCGFATLTLLTKNAFLEEIPDYWYLLIAVLIGGQIGNFLNLKIFPTRALALVTAFLVLFVALRMGVRLFVST